MKRFIAIASIAFLSVGCSSSHDWYSKGDKLVKQKQYKAAYSAYMETCGNQELLGNEYMLPCETARDLRIAAKRHGFDTSNW